MAVEELAQVATQVLGTHAQDEADGVHEVRLAGALRRTSERRDARETGADTGALRAAPAQRAQRGSRWAR